ncbi:hypothetical protein M446_0730 [Methylobacterium sp. 4-46]|uniref:hypothetical protein n=1 Tax=unclassified Methylobacterium TaxID=2615210 RepID=UPI000152C244|nr:MULTISPECIES: hypothetical protein [Methylobacterium]ACA15289.1 hypothetical protein M446_0730 [Methylobacterium sp. 4-46]WFT81016.1 hypothetical protein QA634_03685 [Methylobacterium nodulans]
MANRTYTVRRESDGWGVYALQTGEPVRVNGRAQTGLPLETATELAESLRLLAAVGRESAERPAVERRPLQ